MPCPVNGCYYLERVSVPQRQWEEDCFGGPINIGQSITIRQYQSFQF